MATRTTYRRPDSLELTQDPEANQLIAQDPNALVIGWLLDQQVTVQLAFAGPLKIRQRLGTVDPAKLATMTPAHVEQAFVEKPAVHRYAKNMAKRVQALAQCLVDEYDGDAERVWLDADGYDDLRARIVALPGFGAGKAPGFAAMLARRFGLEVTGFEAELGEYGSLADVGDYEDLLAYQVRKGAYKQALRAQRAAAEGA